MEKTSCHSCFSVCSCGTIDSQRGLVAEEGGLFDPDVITQMLGIKPSKVICAGAPRKSGHGCYSFSEWIGCMQSEPALDAEAQCRIIARKLTPLLPRLREIKQLYRVDYSLIIVPHIYNEETPILGFDSEIISFCHHSGTQISVDMYVYDKE